MTFGDAIFADVVFADLGAINRRTRGGRGRIGGSGFPDNWEAIIAANARAAERERRRLERELEEIRALMALDVL